MAVECRPSGALGLAVAILLGAACAGSSDAPEAPDACVRAPAIPAGQPFAVEGDVTYDLVPARWDPSTGAGGLDFRGARPAPVRSAAVEIRQCGNVLATATTDDAGHYRAASTAPPAPVGQVAVYVLARTPSPPITVRDGEDRAIWAVGARVEDATGRVDVHATHGWTGTGYGPGRIAAPFAILDTMLTAERGLLAVRDVPFGTAPLTVNWSPSTADSYFDVGTRELWIAGLAGVDTDEFDRGVVAHEWAHWLEDRFSRSDSPGGYHGLGSLLDPRVAFDEGSASALSAVLLDDPRYVDTGWIATIARTTLQDAFGWDAETAPDPTDDPAPGPFSEFSVLRALYDLADAGPGEAYDAIALGAGPIWDALAGPQRTTPALTTIASFVAGLKRQAGVDGPTVDAVLAHYDIGAITSEWGDGDASVRAMYTFIPPPTSTPATYGATFDGRYAWNAQPQNHYFVFTGTGRQVTVAAASAYDVDLEAYDAGLFRLEEGPSSTESMTFATAPGHVYVVVLNGAAAGVRDYAATATFSSPSP